MKPLCVAALLGLLTLLSSACSGGGALPAVSSQALKATHSGRGVTRNTCPNDTGGISTGDGTCLGVYGPR
jgi:hypothetical protein